MYRVYRFPLMISGNIHPYETVEEAVEVATFLDDIISYAGENRYCYDGENFEEFSNLDDAKEYAAAYAAAPITVTKNAYSLDPAFHFHAALLVGDIVKNSFKVIDEFSPNTELKNAMKKVLRRER